MNSDNQINELNSLVKLRLAPSKIHGVGLFATRYITRGTRLHIQKYPASYKLSPGNLSKLFPEVKQLLMERWPLMIKGEPFAWPDSYLQGYMNHSDNPNYDLKTDTLTRDVPVGIEITENYRDIDGWQEVFKWLK